MKQYLKTFVILELSDLDPFTIDSVARVILRITCPEIRLIEFEVFQFLIFLIV